MKKIIMLFTISLFMVGCASSKVVKSKEKMIKGNWTLNRITYSKTGGYNVTLFNDVSKECFEGSSWKFVPNNHSGVYTINSNNCNAGDRAFVFTIQEMDAASGNYDFMLKPKNNKNNVGFRLKLTKLSENTMQWQQNLTKNGVSFIINMNFIKQ